ncbi:unnamed protein product [Peniophora sp. CBMAI 1063]|nr:unnamed protein product [Peniophora sp. CBMAI 1063]
MASAARRRPFAQSHPDDKCGDGMWEAYLNVMEEEDSANVESWNGSTTGILTFTGLFAATVAAFLIESYKLLSPDTGAQAVTLLAQLVSMSDPNATLSVPAVDIQSGPFQVSQTAVVVNIFWFLSLIIALVCALLATLIQEWTREYLRDTQKRSQDMTIQEYALNHVFVCMGVERYGLDNVAFVIVALMHTAVTLFLSQAPQL